MASTNNDGDSASPWNMPLCIFTSAKLCPPAVNSTLNKLFDLVGYFICLETV